MRERDLRDALRWALDHLDNSSDAFNSAWSVQQFEAETGIGPPKGDHRGKVNLRAFADYTNRRIDWWEAKLAAFRALTEEPRHD